MGFWEKSVRIFNYLCEAGTQSVRHMAQHTGLSKSSAHRLTQAIVRRDIHPESWVWETAEGRRWLTRCARSQGSNPWQTQGMALDVSLLAHCPLDPSASRRYKTSISLTLWSAGWRRHGSTG